MPATVQQRRKIAQLAQSLGIKDPIEEGIMSMAQAGRQIRHLSDQLKLRKTRRISNALDKSKGRR